MQAPPRMSAELRKLVTVRNAGVLADARLLYAATHDLASLAPWATFPARAPRWPLDWVLATTDLAPLAVGTIGGSASDHRGLAAAYGFVDDAAMLAGHRALGCGGVVRPLRA